MNHKTAQPQKTPTTQLQMKYSPAGQNDDSESVSKNQCEPTKQQQVGFTFQFVRQLKQKFAQEELARESVRQTCDRISQKYEERRRLQNAPSIFKKTIGLFKNWFKNTEDNGTQVQIHTQHQLIYDSLNKQYKPFVPENSQSMHNDQTEPYDKYKSK